MSYGNYPKHEKIKKVLVVKLRNLGDVLLTTPIFSILQSHLPHCQIDAYINEEARPLLADNPHIKEIIGYDRAVKKKFFLQRLLYEFSILRKIRKKKYDLVINLTEGDRGVIVTRVSGALYKVGTDPGSSKKRKVYTHLVKNGPSLRHTVEKNIDALRRIGIFPEEVARKLFFPLDASLEKKVLEKLIFKDYVLIHPTSRWQFKCWPTFKVRALIELLIKEGKNVVVTSGSDEKELQMIDTILAGMKSMRILNLAGKVTLKELGCIIKNARSMFCVDSLPFHIASCVKTPVVALFGPTSEITWGPWQNPHATVITKEISCRPCYQDGCGGSKVSDCLFSIPIEKVFVAIMKKSSLIKEVHQIK
ncbi:MAG: putative lipopolysaccharide heptosyltransferase III [Chlamydiae bacterium CG10_big_fil_rev_8_21_14_0_10_35_9]|nr:MAG: putative lipopolysaccharide heptosyltransferase III [Chlamydiae bacterium CG10_big_fil_rev_8_21_14_0_10_35_9]